mgnify:CR=1 FL=1
MPYLVMVALATITHNIQYHGWMYRFNNLCLNEVNKTTLFYYATWIIGILLVLDPIGLFPGVKNMKGNLFLSLAVFYNGLVLWHYFIDGYIWQFRKNPELKVLIQ